MNLFGRDATIGNFKLSNYGLMLASFDATGSTDDNLGMDHEILEEYIGHNPVPIYLGSKYNSKLKPTATLVKIPEIYRNKMYFDDYECRNILRQLTGHYGYIKMQVESYELGEPVFFNVKISSVSYKKVGNNVAGIILEMECDSQFAWSNEVHQSFSFTSNQSNFIFNSSDDLNSYVLPQLVIESMSDISDLTITNVTDNSWTSKFKSMSANEIITMDSKNMILTTNKRNRIICNDFNMHFFRLLSGKNEIQTNRDINISFTYRVPRKVGFII